MKLVIQRTLGSSVSTAERGMIGRIEKGVCVLVGIGENDTEREISWCHDVILNSKLWPDEAGKPWKLSVKDLNLGVLLVSQFTLYAKLQKKSKLDFHKAMGPIPAKELYDSLYTSIENTIGTTNTQAGEFGGMMEVRIIYVYFITYM
mgnify:CR=1 FL=1